MVKLLFDIIGHRRHFQCNNGPDGPPDGPPMDTDSSYQLPIGGLATIGWFIGCSFGGQQ